MADEKLPQDLETYVRNDLLTTEKRLNTAIRVKAVLLIFMLMYMTWAYVNVRRHVDADALVLALQQYVVDALPGYKDQTIMSLKGAAPAQSKEFMDRLVQAFPRWRDAAGQQMAVTLVHASENLEKEMDTLIGRIVDEESKKVASLSGAEKDAELKKLVVARLGTVTKTMLDEAHVQYSKDLRKLHAELERLRKNKDLKPKEKFERQAIACWVKIMNLHLESVKKDGPI